MEYIGPMWKCDFCGTLDKNKPWKCPNCGKEVCDNCFDRYALCKECSEGLSDEEAIKISNWDSDWEF